MLVELILASECGAQWLHLGFLSRG